MSARFAVDVTASMRVMAPPGRAGHNHACLMTFRWLAGPMAGGMPHSHPDNGGGERPGEKGVEQRGLA
ncbi:hypothetical protein RFM99_20910 [Mesorhizobium sp. VK4C]|uniref:hypothetical protein n=1 Tax=Mesorhizobium captivum TaxID=3072319 RepID=UPI002A23D7C5|nr:hypothetical protein [Mesorhizobium sp. VK4C]MDX8500861.1 hypothetical protein [Mesorhizobium sp. VK4C]